MAPKRKKPVPPRFAAEEILAFIYSLAPEKIGMDPKTCAWLMSNGITKIGQLVCDYTPISLAKLPDFLPTHLDDIQEKLDRVGLKV